jgi:hypothetical protein
MRCVNKKDPLLSFRITEGQKLQLRKKETRLAFDTPNVRVQQLENVYVPFIVESTYIRNEKPIVILEQKEISCSIALQKIRVLNTEPDNLTLCETETIAILTKGTVDLLESPLLNELEYLDRHPPIGRQAHVMQTQFPEIEIDGGKDIYGICEARIAIGCADIDLFLGKDTF